MMDPAIAAKLNAAKAQLDGVPPENPVVVVGAPVADKPRWSATTWASKKRRAKVAKASKRKNRR